MGIDNPPVLGCYVCTDPIILTDDPAVPLPEGKLYSILRGVWCTKDAEGKLTVLEKQEQTEGALFVPYRLCQECEQDRLAIDLLKTHEALNAAGFVPK